MRAPGHIHASAKDHRVLRARASMMAGVLLLAAWLLSAPQAFAATSDSIGAWGALGTGIGQFNMAWGVAVASAGDVYVADMDNNRIQYFGPTGVFKGARGSYGTGNGQLGYP